MGTKADIMAEPVTLEFIAQKLDQVLAEQRRMREDFRFFREELRNQGATLARLEDQITMDVLEAHPTSRSDEMTVSRETKTRAA